MRGGPVRVISAYRSPLLNAQYPMWVLVAYRMLLVSNSRAAPSSDASSCSLTRDKRYSRSRPKSTRFSQSTPCNPGDGVVATGNSSVILASRSVGEPALLRVDDTHTWIGAAPPPGGSSAPGATGATCVV